MLSKARSSFIDSVLQNETMLNERERQNHVPHIGRTFENLSKLEVT